MAKTAEVAKQAVKVKRHVDALLEADGTIDEHVVGRIVCHEDSKKVTIYLVR